MWKFFIHCTTFQKQYQKPETNLFLSWRNILTGNESGIWLLLKTDWWQADEESDSNIGDIMKAVVWHTEENGEWALKVKGKNNKKKAWKVRLRSLVWIFGKHRDRGEDTADMIQTSFLDHI